MIKEFQSEILDIRQQAESYADNKIKPILQAYKRVLEDIRTDIAKIYAEYSVDGVLKIGKQQRYTILKQIEKKLIKQAKELGHIDIGYTTKILEDVFKESYYRTAYVIDKGMETAIKFDILKPEFIRTAVEMPVEDKMFSDRIWDNKSKLIRRVKRDVERAMTEGKSIDKLSRQIKSDFGVSAYESKRLIHTEVARCQSQAQDEIYKNSGVVEKVMWSATLDMATNEEDAKLDGKMWGIDEDHPSPPLHPNCRCSLIPVISGWQPMSRRENIKDNSGEKKTIEYTDYNSWKKSRNIE